QDGDVVAIAQSRVEVVGKTHVIVIDVDIDEAVCLAFGNQTVLDAGIVLVEVVDQFGQGAAVGGDLLLASGERTQNGWNSDGDLHKRSRLFEWIQAEATTVGIPASI